MKLSAHTPLINPPMLLAAVITMVVVGCGKNTLESTSNFNLVVDGKNVLKSGAVSGKKADEMTGQVSQTLSIVDTACQFAMFWSSQIEARDAAGRRQAVSSRMTNSTEGGDVRSGDTNRQANSAGSRTLMEQRAMMSLLQPPVHPDPQSRVICVKSGCEVETGSSAQQIDYAAEAVAHFRARYGMTTGALFDYGFVLGNGDRLNQTVEITGDRLNCRVISEFSESSIK